MVSAKQTGAREARCDGAKEKREGLKCCCARAQQTFVDPIYVLYSIGMQICERPRLDIWLEWEYIRV